MIAAGQAWWMRSEPSKQWMTPIQRAMCRWLQNHLYKFLDALKAGDQIALKLMVVVPRNYLKSQIVTIISNMWCHVEVPNFSSLIGAADEDLSKDFYTPIKAILAGDDKYSKFTWLYGNWYDKKRTWKADELDHAFKENTAQKERSFKLWSVNSIFTGRHPLRADMDDPVTEEKLKEEGGAWLVKADRALNATRGAMTEPFVFVLTGTRYRPDDPIGKRLEREGAKTWTGHTDLSGRVLIDPKKGTWHVFHLQGRNPDTGLSTAPSIHSDEWLDDYERNDPVGFWSQIMNQPGVGEHTGLTMDQIEDMYIAPDELPNGCDYIFFCDTAFKDASNYGTGDESVLVILARNPSPSVADYYYVEGYGHNRYRGEDFTRMVVVKIQEYQNPGPGKIAKRIFLITDEKPISKGETWFHYLKNECNAKGEPCPATKIVTRASGSGHARSKKVKARIRRAQQFWASGRIKLVRGAPGVHKLVYQMAYAEVSPKDDWADACSDAFHDDIYRLMAPVGTGEPGGVAPVGPEDEALKGAEYTQPRRPWNDDVIDTMNYSDEWS